MEKQADVKSRARAEKRHAIYYAPEEGSSLEAFGRSWLGRDARSANTITQPRVAGVSQQRLSDILSAAARYGFHGTLKPPFSLRMPKIENLFFEDIARLEKTEKSFYLPRLCLAQMGRFLALVPETPCPELNQMADRCVRHFDWYRRPASALELNRSRAAGLTSSQEHYLRKWGYPYVMREFRFHLTLTGRIGNPVLARHIKKTLAGLLTEIDLHSIQVESLCVFIQEQADGPFLLHRRYPLGVDVAQRTDA